MGKLYLARVGILALILSFTTACCNVGNHCGGQSNSSSTELSYTVNRHVSKMLEASVAIKSTDKSPRIIGSGVVLRYRKGLPLIVLTAKHVTDHLEDKANIAFCLTDCVTLIPAKTNRHSDKYDLALLVSDNPMKEDGPEAPLASQEPSIGDKVWLCGSPNGHMFNISSGILSSVFISMNDDGLKYYRTDAAAYMGNSGGGLFNDNRELIGILIHIEVGPLGIVPGSAGAVPLDSIKEFLYYSN